MGPEIDETVYEYAMVNMLIRTGELCENIKNKSAFDEHKNKFDIIVSNPPFALKFAKNQINTKWFSNNIKTNNGNLLTLNLLMQLLNDNGYCATIFPNGKELFAKTGADLETRKRLIEQFNVEKIISLDTGAFDYTSIKYSYYYIQKYKR